MKRRSVGLLLLMLLIVSLSAQAAFAQARLAVPLLVVNTSFLNVRSGDGPEYTVVTVVPGGTELPVWGTNGDNSWYLVNTPAGAGWVDVSFTLARGDFRNVPLVEVEGGTVSVSQTPLSIARSNIPVPVVGSAHIVINTSYQNVRSGPGGGFGVIATVPGGTVFYPVGVMRDASWYLVRGDFGQGWVSSEFVLFRGVFSAVPVIQSAY